MTKMKLVIEHNIDVNGKYCGNCILTEYFPHEDYWCCGATSEPLEGRECMLERCQQCLDDAKEIQ